MNCELISGEILDFHFGSLSIERRSFVEGHLLECKECLKEYLALKSDIELSKSSEVKPSAFTRHRIRSDFASYADKQRKIPFTNFHVGQRKLVMSGMAAVATIALVIASIHFRTQDLRQNMTDHSIEQVRTLDNAIDSGSRTPESINIL